CSVAEPADEDDTNTEHEPVTAKLLSSCRVCRQYASLRPKSRGPAIQRFRFECPDDLHQIRLSEVLESFRTDTSKLHFPLPGLCNSCHHELPAGPICKPPPTQRRHLRDKALPPTIRRVGVEQLCAQPEDEVDNRYGLKIKIRRDFEHAICWCADHNLLAL